MRILLVGQPASGLFILAELFSRIYKIEYRTRLTSNLPESGEALLDYIQQGHFSENCVIAGHYLSSQDLIDICAKIDCKIFCVLRNPYVVFELLYLYANRSDGLHSSESGKPLKGKALNLLSLQGFIADNFVTQMQIGVSWILSQGATLVKFEALAASPDHELQQLCKISGKISQAIVITALNQDPKPNFGMRIAEELPDEVLYEISKIFPVEFQLHGYRKMSRSSDDLMNLKILDYGQFQVKYSHHQRVFLVGHGKSGTTWLHLIFYHHPHTGALSERKLIEHPDEKDALFDSLLDKQSFGNWLSGSSTGLHYLKQDSGLRFELARVMSDYLFFRTLLMRNSDKGFKRQQEITHFSEKIALNTRQDAQLTMDTLKKMYPDAKIIHIVRDPRDVAISTMYHSYRNFKQKNEVNWLTRYIEKFEGEQKIWFSSKFKNTFLKKVSDSWSEIVEVFHDFGEQHYPGRYLVVRYEDMLLDPHAVIEKLFDFSGLDYTPEQVTSVVEKTSFKSLADGRVAGHQDTTSFYRKGISGDWKNHIRMGESRKFFSSSARLMGIFGYK